MQSQSNLFKLIVMYMLHQVDFPLSRVQLFDYILDKGQYTDYFTLQSAIADLIESDFVTEDSGHNSTRLSLTGEGVDALSYFQERIPQVIRDEIDGYLSQNKREIKNELSVMTSYSRLDNGDYAVKLQRMEGPEEPLDIILHTSDESDARAVCDKWKDKHKDIYAYLVKELM